MLLLTSIGAKPIPGQAGTTAAEYPYDVDVGEPHR